VVISNDRDLVQGAVTAIAVGGGGEREVVVRVLERVLYVAEAVVEVVEEFVEGLKEVVEVEFAFFLRGRQECRS
jgi:hypothetical protein